LKNGLYSARLNLKRGADLSDGDHVVRHVPLGKTRRDAKGNVLGILPAAIERREGEEYLSVNHLEHFAGTREQQMSEIKAAVTAAKESKTIGAKGLFATANVGELKSAVLAKSTRKIRVAYAPTKHNPSHSAIHDIPEEDMELMDQLADEVFSKTVQVAKV
jgi:hypothetical protein